MITVGEILDLPELQDVTVHMGKSGLHNEIRWVHAIDHDDVGYYLQGKELLLSCGQVWPVTRQAEERLLDSFLQNRIAGMIFATGTYITEIPPSALDFGEKHDIPILEVPFHISFVKLSQSILQKVMNVKHGSVDFKDQVLGNVLDKLKSADSISEICRVLSTNLGSYAIMTNPRGQIFSETMIAGVKYQHIRGMVKRLMRLLKIENGDLTDLEDVKPNQAIHVPSKQSPYGLCVPLKIREQNWVYLWLLNDKRPFDKEDEQVVEYAAVVLTYFVLNEQEAEAARRRLRSECFEHLLSETERDSLTVEELAQELGLVPNANWLSGFVLSGEDTTAKTLVLWRELCQRWIDETHGISGFCEFYHERLLLAVSSSASINQLEDMFAALYHSLLDTKNAGAPVLVFGRMKQTLHHLSASHREAMSLAPIVRYRNSDGGVFLADRFQRDMYLYSSFNAPRAQALRDLILPEELFSEKGAPLYETLKCLSLYNYNRDQVAKALHIHRNTLRYRIRRIEHILGDRLSSPQCQFWVRVALDLESISKNE